MSFDWQTGEKEWETEATTEDRRRPTAEANTKIGRAPRLSTRRRRIFLLVGLAVVLVGGLAAVIVRQVNRRAAAAEAVVEAEVAAGHEALVRAAADRDAELFVFLLSGRDQEWAETQEELIDSGQFYDRSGGGFAWLRAAEGSNSEQIVSVSVDPQLQRAEVVSNERYVVRPGPNISEMVTLQYTAVYRRGPDRWLYAPPEPEFWGENQVVRGQYLSLRFPIRDEEVARRLHADLDRVLGRLCAILQEDCPNDLAVEVELSSDPASLLEFDNPLQRWTTGVDVTLPTVTLIGRPLGETGYQMLFRDYASRLVASTLTELTGWTCCSHSLYYGTFMAAQLEALGLREWPDTSESFLAVIQDPQFASQEMQAFWRGGGIDPSPRNVLPAYALVEFLIHDGVPLSVFEMQQTLVRNPGLPYWAWLQDVTGGRYLSLNDFQRDLLGYALERVPVNSPIAPPNDDLQLVCWSMPRYDRPALYRYDPANRVLDRERGLGSSSALLGGLPDDQGVVVASLPTTQVDGSTFIWRDGQGTPVTYGAFNQTAALLPLPLNAPGNLIPFLVWDPSLPPYALLSLDQCDDADGCYAQTLLGPLIWSPDGSQTLLTVGGQLPVGETPLAGGRSAGLLMLADSRGRRGQSLEMGTSPFWLDDATIGYVLPYSAPHAQVAVSRRLEAPEGLPGDQYNGLFSTDHLFDATTPSYSGGLHVDRIIVSPAYPDQLFVLTADPLGIFAVSYLLTYDLEQGELRIRHRLVKEPSAYQRGYRLSPDGRWLLIASLIQSAVAGVYEPTWRLYLHDIPNNVTREFEVIVPDWPAHWMVDWSADGRWLSLVSNGYVRLIPLDSEPWSEWPVVFEGLKCHSAVWVAESAAPGFSANATVDNH